MKKFYVSALALAIALGGTSAAHANWFSNKSDNDRDARIETSTSSNQMVSRTRADIDGDGRVDVDVVSNDNPTRYDATAHDAEAQKWIYNGSSAYRGGLAGQVAMQDSMNDGDETAFVVRPVRGSYNQFNASLRSGDMGQSDETRINHSFNN